MVFRTDHIAGAAFVVFGILIVALSGDLPTGQLSMPGSGFLPKIVATLTILFGLTLVVRASAESPPFSDISWGDGTHAALVTVIAALAVLLYIRLGFLITMTAMMVALLVVIERRKPLHAIAYSLSVVLIVYGVFHYVLKAPLPAGSFVN